jgi:RNA polymerase sigma-70 factor (ECF subfamily)
MLGSLSEAEDAVQEAWLRLNRSDTEDVDNLAGWLTTVVSRVCLDMLRTRRSRREEHVGVEASAPEPAAGVGDGADPEREALLADAVGVALLVVLDALAPAERLAFVLHDLLGVPFEDIGPIVGRTTDAARQLAHRARRRVRGAPAPADADRGRQRAVVEAFLRATRAGDLNALLAVLEPDAVIHIEAAARIDAPPAEVGRAREVRGAAAWVGRFVAMSRGLRFVQLALVDGNVGLVVAPRGRLSRVLLLTFCADKIARVEIVADPDRLRALEIAVL